jgi:FHA domain-containing protein
MSTKPQAPYSPAPASDLDTTADYPPIAPSGAADTWVMPPRAADDKPEDPVRAYREEIRTLRESVAGVTLIRDHLQADLRALTSKRHELEELLLTRDGLLSKHEQELAARQQEIAALRASLAAATTSREQLQAELSALSKPPQEAAPTAADSEAQRLEHERELAVRDQCVAKLNEELAARAEQHFLVSAERDDLQARLERARADLSSVAQKRERKTSAQADAEREHALRAAALARSRDDMTELQRRVARNREALQRAEARRQVFEAMLRDREEMLDERDARLRALQAELDQQRRDHGSAPERANGQLSAALGRSGATAGQSVPPSQDTAPVAADPEAQQRIAALEAQLTEVHGSVRTLHEQLQAEQAASHALRGELAAAERQLQEAASSVRHGSTRRTPPAAEPPAAAPPLARSQRLLVRTSGDAGIVYVLGRRTTIGRVPANDLCIEADSVSRHHALVLLTDTATLVEDLNSTNGVFVNDVRVSRHELREGDVLTIGRVSFRYVLKPEASQA